MARVLATFLEHHASSTIRQAVCARVLVPALLPDRKLASLLEVLYASIAATGSLLEALRSLSFARLFPHVIQSRSRCCCCQQSLVSLTSCSVVFRKQRRDASRLLTEYDGSSNTRPDGWEPCACACACVRERKRVKWINYRIMGGAESGLYWLGGGVTVQVTER